MADEAEPNTDGRPSPEARAPLPSRLDGAVSQRGRSHFLERQTYRRARLEDAARLLPILGLFLFILPITIQSTAAGFGGGTVRWLIFFMAVWLGLICLAALLSRALRSGDKRR